MLDYGEVRSRVGHPRPQRGRSIPSMILPFMDGPFPAGSLGVPALAGRPRPGRERAGGAEYLHGLPEAVLGQGAGAAKSATSALPRTVPGCSTTAKVLGYLFGECDEHTDPHRVASCEELWPAALC